VFYPNIRGSVGYGQKFVEANRGDWGGGDFKDVMAGVEDLVKRGLLIRTGWDWRMVVRRVYGGVGDYADERVQGGGFWAGMANLISEFGTEDHPAGDEWFYGCLGSSRRDF